MAGALDGVRVLELARYQAGPRGGMILSDLGAEVIKIEKLGGEETRRSEPLVRGQSVYFSVYNRGKKSLCLDMRTERGKEIFAALVPTADIVLENFRPGMMAQMGFGYDQLRELKPDIILTSVSGFGQYGPYRERPAFDPLGQAMSGLMSLTGAPVGQPLGAATSLVDRYTSLHATIGTLAALHHRDRTGEGQLVDCCLMDSGFTMVEIPTSYYLATGEEGGEGGRPPYKCKDGHVVISASGRAMATRLMQIVTGNDERQRRGLDQPRRARRPAQGGRGVVRREHRRPHRQDPARRRDPGRAGQDDPAGRRGPASLGARDAGQDGGPARRRDVPARRDDQDVEDPRPRRPGADPGPAHRRGALGAARLRPRDLARAARGEGDRLKQIRRPGESRDPLIGNSLAAQ